MEQGKSAAKEASNMLGSSHTNQDIKNGGNSAQSGN
jgi:hypothetical protein